MKIQVVYKNGEEDQIEQKFLDILLRIGEIQEFRRNDHWVNATSDPIRVLCQDEYKGEDRRLNDPHNLEFSQ